MDILGSNLVTITGVRHHDTVLERLWGLVQSRDKVDFGLAGCGRLLQAHQLILGLFFEPRQLLDIGPQHWQGSNLDLVIEFVYLGKVTVPENQMDTLLELARQLDFTMLVNALLSTENTIRVANPATSCSGLRIGEVRSCDNGSFSSVGAPSALLSAACDSDKMEFENHAENNWVPLVPKLEPDSDDIYNDNNDRSQNAEQMTDVDQQDIAESFALEVDGETGCNEHQSGNNSVAAEYKTYSEINSESLVPFCGGVEQSVATNKAVFERIEVEFNADDEDTENARSHDVGPSEIHAHEVRCAQTIESNRGLSSGGCLEAHDVSIGRSSQGEVVCDGAEPPNEFGGSVEARKFARDSRVKSRADDGNVAGSGSAATGAAASRFKCDTCQKTVRSRYLLKFHLRVHTGEKPYQCRVCPKSFVSPEYLKKHYATHAAGKQYKCQVCLKSFASAGYLKTHIAVLHTGEKQFGCDVCQKSFSSFEYLKKHTVLHTTDRPYQCQVCLKTFPSTGHLTIHSRTHLISERSYKCQLCPRAFKSAGSLKTHSKLHTAENALSWQVWPEPLASGCDLKGHSSTVDGGDIGTMGNIGI